MYAIDLNIAIIKGIHPGIILERELKKRELSKRIACATISDASTMIGGSAFGRMWRRMICRLPRPERLAASTNSRVLSDKTSPRTSRATGGHDTIEIAMITKVRLG